MEDIINAIGDCKATKGINNIYKKDLKHEFADNKRFLNEYFEKYNKSESLYT